MLSTLTIHADVNNSAKLRYVSLVERMKLEAVTFIANGAVTAHATDGVELKVFGNDGATAAFEYSSLSSKDGTIADATVKEMLDQGKANKLVFPADTACKISIDGSLGGGKAADIVVCLHFSKARLT